MKREVPSYPGCSNPLYKNTYINPALHPTTPKISTNFHLAFAFRCILYITYGIMKYLGSINGDGIKAIQMQIVYASACKYVIE